MNTNIIKEVFMKGRNREYRTLAVKRFRKGEKPSSICATLNRLKVDFINGSIAILMRAITGMKAVHVALLAGQHRYLLRMMLNPGLFQ